MHNSRAQLLKGCHLRGVTNGRDAHWYQNDRFWYQIGREIPIGEKSVAGQFKITCDRVLTIPYYRFHEVQGLRQGGWWECFCRPIEALEQPVWAFHYDCITFEHIMHLESLVAWVTAPVEDILATLSITRIGDDGEPLSASDPEAPRYSTSAPNLVRDVLPGQYIACLHNHGRFNAVLHAGTIPARDNNLS